MPLRNVGICTCGARTPADFVRRDGQVWLHKECPTCGASEGLVSTDAQAWERKRALLPVNGDGDAPCAMQCDRCDTDHQPSLIFLDVTSRCNMRCPICVATIRGMADFNPPLAYFDRIFAALARMNPRPVVQLFGGEPTVRNDLLDIVELGRRHGLKPHVFTNGLRLADEAYCRKLCAAGVPLRFAFDGRSPTIYERLRGNRAAYELKLKALDNLRRFSRRKHSLLACCALGVNEQYLDDLLQFCHDNRDLFTDIGLIPLTENWDPGAYQVSVHTTIEDVEKMVAACRPPGELEFVPAGLGQSLRRPREFFSRNPVSEVLLFAGVHPNCESMTLLVSDGRRYRGINHYLKLPLHEFAVQLAARCDALAPRLAELDPGHRWSRLRGQWLVLRTVGWWALRQVRIARLHPVRSILRVLAGRLAFKLGPLVGMRKRRARTMIRLAVLPIEEQHSIDAARLRHCKAAFVYEDVDDGRVKFFPGCSWYPFRNARLAKITQKYGVV